VEKVSPATLVARGLDAREPSGNPMSGKVTELGFLRKGELD